MNHFARVCIADTDNTWYWYWGIDVLDSLKLTIRVYRYHLGISYRFGDECILRSIPIPIPIPSESIFQYQYQYQYLGYWDFQFQYQYQYRPKHQYLNTNTRYCLCLLYSFYNIREAAQFWWNINISWQASITIQTSYTTWHFYMRLLHVGEDLGQHLEEKSWHFLVTNQPVSVCLQMRFSPHTYLMADV